MKKPEYFQQALSDFTFDVSCGGAIHHLADLEYSVHQIMRELDYPVSFERVQQAVFDFYLEQGRILKEEPGKELHVEKAVYRQEYDSYGRKTFRRIVEEEVVREPVKWREVVYRERSYETFPEYLAGCIQENGQENSYMSCGFALAETGGLNVLVPYLDQRQIEYLEGILWDHRRMMYHRMTPKMTEILCQLVKAGLYHGICYFLKTQTRVEI